MSPVAIVGMAALMPGARTMEDYWRNLVDGVDAITDVPPHRWDEEFYDPELAHRPDRMYCRRGGFVDEYATFEPLKFGIMPASVADIEPDQLITLEVAAAAIEDAGGQDRLPAGDRVGVIVGRGGILSPAQARYAQRVRMSSQVLQILRELIPGIDEDRLEAVRRKFDERLGPQQPEGTIGLVPNLTASRVANRLNLRGPAYTLDAACASSLIAVDQGITELNNGRLDAVLACGVHHVHDISFWSVFSQLRALSRQGDIRPFDSGADGLLIGEGTGVVVLKRLADAMRDGDRIYAVIRGCGVSSDGKSASMFNPASSGQALAIRRAWESAGMDPTAPDALGLLEAHGTGTPTGDAAELETVADVFGPHRGGSRPVIGSVKSMIGHTMPAAGMAGLIKATLAVNRGVLLPTLNCENPRPEMERTRFAPISVAQPWECDGTRRAGVNAFGFGGINAHVIVEQPPAPARRHRGGSPASMGGVTVDEPDQVLWLAAPDPAALARLLDTEDETVRAMGAERARANGPTGPDDRCRLGIVDPTDKRLATARLVVAKGRAWRGGRDIWFSPRPLLADGARGRIGFVFPGLEADFKPRVDDIADHFGLAAPDLSAENVGRQGVGIHAVGRLLNEALARIGITPDTVAGYSLGEWTGGLTAGMVSEASVDEFLKTFDPDSIELLGLAFGAIGAGAAKITPLLSGYPGVVLSHDNAPLQCVVCGPEAEVERLIQALRADNILCQMLPFRSGFHTPALEPHLGPLREATARWEVFAPRVPMWSATLAAPFPTDPAQARELFIRHLVEPVRFRPMIAAMHSSGIRAFLQVGTGQLATIISDNLRDRDHLAIAVNVPHRSGLNQLRRVATALWVEGAAPDLRALDAPAGTAQPAKAASTPARRGPVMKLDLGGPLVRLGEGAAGLLGLSARPAETAPTAAAGNGAGATSGAPVPAKPDPAVSSAALAALHRLAGRSSAAAELADLLRDTAHSAVSVMDAAHSGPSKGTANRPAPNPPVRPVSRPVMTPVSRPAVAPVTAAAAAHGAAPAPAVVSASAPGVVSGAGSAATEPGRALTATRPAVPAPRQSPEQATVAGTPPRPPADAAPPATPRTGGGKRGTGDVIHRTVLHVSTETMPYLLDHCFFRQPDDWPTPEDRWPVVPATTVVQHMMDVAEQAVPGKRVVAVRDARFNRWVLAAPAQDIEVTVKQSPSAPDRLVVNFGTFAKSIIEVADAYPTDAPEVWEHDPATEWPPQISAAEMYTERYMFHGPLFHGVTDVHALGDMHIRGIVTTPQPPGALLDNALQILGNWLITTQPFRTVALPVGLGHIRFFGPPPIVGEQFECVARVTEIHDFGLVADIQLIEGGRVWAQMNGCVDRRFDSHPAVRPAERFPERHGISALQPEGWTMVFDAWTDLIARDMAARHILGTDAHQDFERQPAATRKQWMLGRIAVKDAVRYRQWESGVRDVFPIELQVNNDPNGRPRVQGRPGRNLRDCDVSLAHCAEIGVAIAKPRTPGSNPDRPGVGIDVAEVTDHPDSTVAFALTDADRRLLDQVAGAATNGSAGDDRRLWFTRFWVAKEAAAKAEGTGFDGNPKRFVVVAATPTVLTVEVADRVYRVEHREVSNPEDLPPRQYVVGWTWGPEAVRAKP